MLSESFPWMNALLSYYWHCCPFHELAANSFPRTALASSTISLCDPLSLLTQPFAPSSYIHIHKYFLFTKLLKFCYISNLYWNLHINHSFALAHYTWTGAGAGVLLWVMQRTNSQGNKFLKKKTILPTHEKLLPFQVDRLERGGRAVGDARNGQRPPSHRVSE